MRTRIHGQRIAVLGVVLLLLQVLTVGLGPGLRICMNPACPVAVSTISDGCCDCAGGITQVPAQSACDCSWLPITSGDEIERAVAASPPAMYATAPPVLLPLPATPARSAVRPPVHRQSPHLSSLRSIVLTC